MDEQGPQEAASNSDSHHISELLACGTPPFSLAHLPLHSSISVELPSHIESVLMVHKAACVCLPRLQDTQTATALTPGFKPAVCRQY